MQKYTLLLNHVPYLKVDRCDAVSVQYCCLAQIATIARPAQHDVPLWEWARALQLQPCKQDAGGRSNWPSAQLARLRDVLGTTTQAPFMSQLISYRIDVSSSVSYLHSTQTLGDSCEAVEMSHWDEFVQGLQRMQAACLTECPQGCSKSGSSRM